MPAYKQYTGYKKVRSHTLSQYVLLIIFIEKFTVLRNVQGSCSNQQGNVWKKPVQTFNAI